MLRRIAAHLRPAPTAAATEVGAELAQIQSVHAESLFRSDPAVAFDAAAAEELDTVGHVVLPGLLTDEACEEYVHRIHQLPALMSSAAIRRCHRVD